MRPAAYLFSDLADGSWTIKVEMPGFAAMTATETVAANTPGKIWQLRMLPMDQMNAQPKAAATVISGESASAPGQPAPAAQQPNRAQATIASADANQSGDDGFLINGSVNNGAASPFGNSPRLGTRAAARRSSIPAGLA